MYASMAADDFVPHLQDDVWHFPVHHVRGGTSTGLIIREDVTPPERNVREELLRHLMGVPLTGTRSDNRQLSGLGRMVATSNKVFLAYVDAAPSRERRIVSTLAQLAAGTAVIDWSVNCGNMSAALPIWAASLGLLRCDAGIAEVEILNTNTKANLLARMERAVSGAWHVAEIAGVDGRFPAVDLFLADPVGAKTGALLPTGKAIDRIHGIEASCVDVAVPMVIARAASFGKSGREPVQDLENDEPFMHRLRAFWVESGLRMRLRRGDGTPMNAEDLARSETIPKVCLIARTEGRGHITARYFTPQSGHRAMAVTGGCCLASACLIPGTVASRMAAGLPDPGPEPREVAVDIEHPAGILSATVVVSRTRSGVTIHSAAYQRTAQILLQGYVPLYRASDALRAALQAALTGRPALLSRRSDAWAGSR